MPEFWSSLYKIDTSGKYWNIFSYKILSTEIIQSLTELIEKGLYSGRHNGALKIMKSQIEDIKWPEISPGFQAYLSQEDVDPVSEYLEALWIISEFDSSGATAITTLAQTQGHILNILFNANQKQDFNAVAWAVFLFIYTVSPTTNPPPIFKSNEGFQLLQNIFTDPTKYLNIVDFLIQILLEYKVMDSWIEQITPEKTAYGLCKTMILKSIEENNISDLFSGELIVHQWDFITEALEDPETWDPFVKQAVEGTSLLNAVLSASFEIEKGCLYTSMICSQEKQDPKFVTWILSGLKKIDENEWLKELHNECNCVELLIELLNRNQPVELSQKLQDALVKYAQEVLSGTVKPEYLAEFWHQIPDALDSTNRILLKKRLLDHLENAQAIPSDFYKFYGDEIADPEIIRSRSDLVRKVFSPLIIEKRDVAGLNWLIKLLESNPDLFITHSQPTDVADMMQRIKNEVKSDVTDEASLKLVELVKLLNINLEEEEEKNENELDNAE